MTFRGKLIFSLLVVFGLIYMLRLATLSMTNANTFIPAMYAEMPDAVPKPTCSETCSRNERVRLINAKLHIRRNQNVNTTALEESCCFRVDTNKMGMDRIVNEVNFANTKCEAVNKSFLKPNGTEVFTALASIPGSGNTWLRHLLEELTGIYTGDVHASGLSRSVFKVRKEIHNVIAIKTHLPDGRLVNYTRAIIIVRDLFEAHLAETYRRNLKNKTGLMSEEQFNKTNFSHRLPATFASGFVNRLLNMTKAKNGFITNWIRNFRGDLFVLFYENLKRDFLNSLTKLAAFLNWEISMKKLWCILINQEGSFHRPGKPEWSSRKNLINDTIEEVLLEWRQAISNAVENRTMKYATN